MPNRPAEAEASRSKAGCRVMAEAKSSRSRRVITLPSTRAGRQRRSQLPVPGRAVVLGQERAGFRVADHVLFVGIPAYGPLELQGDVGEVARGHAAVAALAVGGRELSRFHAVQEVADMRLELVADLLVSGVRDRLSA